MNSSPPVPPDRPFDLSSDPEGVTPPEAPPDDPAEPGDRPPSRLPRIRLRTPADLLAVIPYLLGFQPTDSVVAVALRDHRLVFVARGDLPGPAGPAAASEPVARELTAVVRRQGPAELVVVGYGPVRRVRPALTAVRDAARWRGLPVLDLLRVEDGRWWSETCQDPRCCPPDGTPVEPTDHRVAAGCTVAGLAPAADRDDLAARIHPREGADPTPVAEATDRAERTLLAWLATVPAGERADAILRTGAAAVREAVDRYAAGGILDDDRLGRLSLLLAATPVRDLAWQEIGTVEPHLRLWTDVTRRVVPELVPAPASLLAFTAWRSGDGALARIALERALTQDPEYSMARLLLRGIEEGLPPSVLDDWGSPQWRARLGRGVTEQRVTGAAGDRATREHGGR